MIELHGLSKMYRSLLRTRTVQAVDDLTLTAARGEVLGIAGPNGAGKSTLISLLLGLLRPSRGTAKIDGLAPRAFIERYGVGYLAELVAVPPKWSVAQTLRRCATLSDVPGAAVETRVEEQLRAFDLDGQRDKRAHQLSKGNLQRLGIAQALIGDHDLLIFDEPTYGLDPVWTQQFRGVVHGLRRPNRTILIASHNLDELERLADRVVILHRGRVERIVNPGGLHPSAASATYRLKLATTADASVITSIVPHAEPVEGRPGEWRLRGELGALNHEIRKLFDAGIVIASFAPEESRLESEFRLAMGSGR